MTTPDRNRVEQIRARIDAGADRLARHLGGPLLVMYYPDEASIEVEDIAILYQHLRRNGLTPDSRLPNLNVVLHTLGGDANASYRLAQLLRDFADLVKFIIPEQAYSGGTTITLAGDEIVLAHCAVLSPIDVGLVPIYDESEEGDRRGKTRTSRYGPLYRHGHQRQSSDRKRVARARHFRCRIRSRRGPDDRHGRQPG